MRNKINALIFIVIGVGLLTTGSAFAYNRFSGNNNCDQCHDGFDSYGSDTHSEHIAEFSCNACHVSNGDNPLISTCSECHNPNLLWNFHLQFAPDDQNGMDCAACHSVTADEKETWDSVKSRYREALFNN